MAKRKEILIGIEAKNGGCVHIVGCSDNGLKPLYIYFDVSDSGDHYARMCNAVKRIRDYARAWDQNGIEYKEIYGSPDDIPVHGCSEWNTAMFKYNYCGKEFPDARKYFNY